MAPSAATNPEELLRRARDGAARDLGRLFELYRQYLRLLARVQIDARLQGKVDPSDLVQETFADAHRDFEQFRGSTEGEFVMWLRTIMANKTAEVVRRYSRKKRDVHLERELEGELERSSRAMGAALVAPGTSPSANLARRERAVALADALARLPADCREAIILHHLEGKTMEQVARTMGRSLDSVRGLWSRAIVKLRHALRDHSHET
ncbi:MAG: sigma-70 family RNA polymerase sigma factor [Planctomycetia bacterium]|nr:sigma-70 family RNA polymerase sigma factor [Planctomycetia bacterium]